MIANRNVINYIPAAATVPLQAQKARKVSNAEDLVKKAAGDTKVQKLIGKKKASAKGRPRKGRGKTTQVTNESPGDANGGDDNAEDHDDKNDNNGGDAGEPTDGPLNERWAAIDSWGCLNKNFFPNPIY